MNWVLCPAPPGPFLESCKRYGVILLLSVAVEQAWLMPLSGHIAVTQYLFQQKVDHHTSVGLFHSNDSTCVTCFLTLLLLIVRTPPSCTCA
jgi:hypothetical protein